MASHVATSSADPSCSMKACAVSTTKQPMIALPNPTSRFFSILDVFVLRTLVFFSLHLSVDTSTLTFLLSDWVLFFHRHSLYLNSSVRRVASGIFLLAQIQASHRLSTHWAVHERLKGFRYNCRDVVRLVDAFHTITFGWETDMLA